MRILFLRSPPPREAHLLNALAKGSKKENITIRNLPTEYGFDQRAEWKQADIVAFVGVKGRPIRDACLRDKKPFLYFDKSYFREESRGPTFQWWRVSVNEHHPLRFLSEARMPGDRMDWRKWGWTPFRRTGRYVLFAGASAKNHRFYGLPEPTEYAKEVCQRILDQGHQVVYRPKPSWREATLIANTTFDKSTHIRELLKGARALVTHNSGACLEAVLCGVPSVILGPGISAPLFPENTLANLNDLMTPSRPAVTQWLSNLSYCQWSIEEISAGQMWKVIRPQLEQLL